jgi:hypothetical protein
VTVVRPILTVMNDSEHFRLLFWRTFIPLFALPVFGGFIAVSPVVEGWTWRSWTIAGAVVGGAVALYLLRAWLRSDVILDERGLTLYATSGLQTWPYEKLLKVKQVGKYRVRMCFDPDIPETHMHITVDLFDSDGFADALLDRYAEAMGHELPELHPEPAADEQAAA